MRFIHAADIHLDSALHGLERYEGAPVEEIRSATRRAFDNLIDLAIDEEVAFVLLVGDLYDGDWKDYNTGLYFVERMGRLREASIRVFIVAGNHDAASQITKHLRLPDNVTLFSTKRPEQIILEDLNVAVYGQGFATRAVTDDLSQAYPQGDPQLFNIGLLHTCLDGKPGHEPYAPCTVDGLRSKGYQYWALGHVHNREEVSRDPWIVFPGNIQGRHIREIGPKGCTLVTVENGEIEEVEHRDLDVMRWSLCELDVSASESVDDIYGQVQNPLQTGLNTDRFLLEWHLMSDRVRERVRGQYQRAHAADWLSGKDIPLVNYAAWEGGLPRPLAADLEVDHDHVLVQVPPDLQRIKHYDLGIAQAWRDITRCIFETYFRRGYVVAGFASSLQSRLPNLYRLERETFTSPIDFSAWRDGVSDT